MKFFNKKIIPNIHWMLRIYLAYVLVPIGFKKLGVMVNDMKIIGYLVGPFELLGPLLIIIGAFKNIYLTRIGSAMIMIIMAGAMYLHLFSWGHGFNDITPALHLFIISTYFLIRGNNYN